MNRKSRIAFAVAASAVFMAVGCREETQKTAPLPVVVAEPVTEMDFAAAVR